MDSESLTKGYPLIIVTATKVSSLYTKDTIYSSLGTKASRVLNIPRKDDIDRLISDMLSQDLSNVGSNEILLLDHPCFDLARQYTQK